jgi:hypothetical protein
MIADSEKIRTHGERSMKNPDHPLARAQSSEARGLTWLPVHGDAAEVK